MDSVTKSYRYHLQPSVVRVIIHRGSRGRKNRSQDYLAPNASEATSYPPSVLDSDAGRGPFC
jgi:hypothetical protein